MLKFSIKIDDDSHSLTKENGINLDKVGDLLQKLYNAIELGTGSKITLGEVRGNCYALDFFSEDLNIHNAFVVVHQNIAELSIDDLPPEQRPYANSLKVVLGNRYFMKAYNKDGEEIAKISDIVKTELPSYYYSTDSVYGVLSELGSPSLLSNKKHIFIDGVSYKIYITKEQDLDLRKYYGVNKLRFELRQKRSSITGNIISSELKSFIQVGNKGFYKNFEDEKDDLNLEIIKDSHTIEDILNAIYASK